MIGFTTQAATGVPSADSSEFGLDLIPGHLHAFGLMHRAMRRDARRLIALAASAADRPERLPAVVAWWERLHAVIDWHHHSEDEVFWPELRRRTGVVVAAADDLDADHAALDRAMAAVTAALAGPHALSALPMAAAQFDTLIHDHLRREEAAVFPVLARVGVREYLAVERRLIASAPRSIMPYLQPWMFDGADPRWMANVLATVPAPVRLLSGTVLRRRYERTLSAAGLR
ncbi:hemerythrin domain-containing protein [Yinghuangia soli]|uniref:Hemerythrin domain-containing protein n=1 Tax=Yinghuangia soli TaxID=2908204 RepID=A0AA41Q6V9_9ACTN|nr:hemerythrin domain-containing protein [Yinghuangia soli]MCF2532361.1 hemerythrin domain-containing protein [Yinghuangia soli]